VGSGGAIFFQAGANRFLDGYVRRNTALSGDGFTSGVGGGFYFFQPLQGSAVRGCELTGNRALVGGAITVQGTVTRSFSDVQIQGNTIAGNFASIADVARYGGGGLHFFDDFIGEVVDNIIAMQEDGCGISCEGQLASPNIRYNCVWNDPASNTDPKYGENCTDRTGINGNIGVNPVFCCFAGGCLPVGNPPPDVQLAFGSPCLGTGEGGTDMGAYPGATSCTNPVSLESASWGKIKSLYR
jgi:hypothetical protein